jgi:hypothetical protein
VLARLTERGVLVMIVQTSRTPAEQEENLKNGTTKVQYSKHLPRRLRGFPLGEYADADKCDAIDLCPYDVYLIAGPDKLAWAEYASPQIRAAWKAIGEIGEALDLRWGGRWSNPHDPGHLELIISDNDRRLASAERLRGDVTA